jgi:hypothetical protein
MAFTLNAGEFDLGGGCIGRGTILAGEAYSNTNLQNLLNTAGLEGLANVSTIDTRTANVVFFRESDDGLTGAPSFSPYLTDYFIFGLWTIRLDNQSRFYIATSAVRSDANTDIVWSGINSSTSNTLQAVVPQIYPFENNFNTSSINWRFLCRDRATAVINYPSTTVDGSIFAASFVNSSSQWGLWAAGAVGNRPGYFNQRQGDFAIVLLQNGASTYFSVMSPTGENLTVRNDSRLRSPNIIAAPGQSGDDRFSELLLFRDQGNGYSQQLGIVPGFIYVDMNRSENSALAVGDNLTIEPGSGTTYELNKGAIIVARWGLDISATISNVGSLFTVATISTPGSATLASGNRNRWILESNQRIRFTATPPTGLSVGVDYWIIGWDPVAFTFQLSATQNGTAIVPSSDTSSTITRFAALIAMPSYSEL